MVRCVLLPRITLHIFGNVTLCYSKQSTQVRTPFTSRCGKNFGNVVIAQIYHRRNEPRRLTAQKSQYPLSANVIIHNGVFPYLILLSPLIGLSGTNPHIGRGNITLPLAYGARKQLCGSKVERFLSNYKSFATFGALRSRQELVPMAQERTNRVPSK